MKKYLLLLLMTLFSFCNTNKSIPVKIEKIVEIKPEISVELVKNLAPGIRPDESLRSFQKNNEIYTMTFYGDYDKAMDQYNEVTLYFLKNRKKFKKLKVSCSMFSRFISGGSRFYGRNYDNVDTDLLVAYYFPKNGYRSIGFVPLTNFKYSAGEADKLQDPEERGITVSLASMAAQKINVSKKKKSRYLLLLIKEILDHAGTLEEAVSIIGKYNVVDNSIDILSHHIFIGGPDGRSVLAEVNNGEMRFIYNRESWQGVTNTVMYGIEDDLVKGLCRRYKKLSNRMKGFDKDPKEVFTLKTGLQLLSDISQDKVRYNLPAGRIVVSTQWSAIFDMGKKEVYLSLHRDYSKIYRLIIPEIN